MLKSIYEELSLCCLSWSNVLLVSVIIPVYNEKDTVLLLLEKIKRQDLKGFELEVIVIDDNSNDGSNEILKKNPHLFTKLIELDKNRGKGFAVKEGLKIANGEYILFQDADLEYDPSDYENILEIINKFNGEVIIGSRFLAPRYAKVQYFTNRIGNLLVTTFFNMLYNTTFTDIYSCYLCYKKSLVDPNKLKSNGWSQHAEILSIAVKSSKKLYEVPISYNGRTFEEGKKIRSYHIIPVIYMILKKRIF